jgi:DNA-binding NarL/FixJ family response regulator
VTVGVYSQQEIVREGVVSLLSKHPDKVMVLATPTRAGEPEPDVVLYDVMALLEGDTRLLGYLVDRTASKVLAVGHELRPELIEQAIAAGASGYLSKVLTGPQIVAALERVMRGEIVILPGRSETSVDAAGDWPGRSAGLTPREAEILALITQGLTNQDIATRAFLSINSVKTYIRSAYRKINVTRRSQAVLWGVENGFKPDTLRTLDPALLLRPPAEP